MRLLQCFLFVGFQMMLFLAPGYTLFAAQAETRGQKVQFASAPKRYALIIGVDRYDDSQITPLAGAANDAGLLAKALVQYAGYSSENVTLLASDQPSERQPTRGNILRKLSNLAGIVPQDGLLLLAFSGHGLERNQKAFLLPADTQLSRDNKLFEQTAISVDFLKEQIRTTGVQQVMLLLDACRTDPTSGRTNSTNPLTSNYARSFNFDLNNRDISAFVILFATNVGQRAYEYKEKKQGYFTWQLIEALKGQAANERGEVTLEMLVRNLQTEVPKRVQLDLGEEQKPFAIVEGYRADELIIATSFPKRSAEPPVDAARIELAFWETIRESKNSRNFEAYLRRYPNGQFADLAKIKLEELASIGGNTTGQPNSTSIPNKTIPTSSLSSSGKRIVFENKVIRITVKSLKKVRDTINLVVIYENLEGLENSIRSVGVHLLDENGERWDYASDTVGFSYHQAFIPNTQLTIKISFKATDGTEGQVFSFHQRISRLKGESINVIINNIPGSYAQE